MPAGSAATAKSGEVMLDGIRLRFKAQAIEVQVHRLQTIMSLLEHGKVDLIKMGIEGAEYGVIEDMVRGFPVAGGAKQLLVEFHHRFPGKGIVDTNVCIESLERSGFRSFHISENGVDWGFLWERQEEKT